MASLKIIRSSLNNGRKKEQIYCRRHNRLYTSCPVENDLNLCECLAQCEMALKLTCEDSLTKAG